MLNIVIPMAGRGSRFASAGFTAPKPLIPLGGRPMIQWVIDNVCPTRAHRFIFICQAAHLAQYPMVETMLRRLAPGCEIVTVAGVTEGAACTVLAARELINSSDPLMIANSDQFVDCDIDEYLACGDQSGVSGHIMTFTSDNPKWSYCRLKIETGTVAEVVEKEVVSNEATVGIYNYRQGEWFVSAAEEMIRRDLRVNGEFYVAPAYNLMIEAGHRVVTANLERTGGAMYGLGTPEDYYKFQDTACFRRRNSSGSPVCLSA